MGANATSIAVQDEAARQTWGLTSIGVVGIGGFGVVAVEVEAG